MHTSELQAEPAARRVEVTDQHLQVDLADGGFVRVPLAWFPRLLHATPAERSGWRLLGAGSAIEWPEFDEHIGVEALLAGRGSGETAESLARWLRSRQAAA
jgi:hypothetical protein